MPAKGNRRHEKALKADKRKETGWVHATSSAVREYLKIQRDLGVAPPVFALLTLLGVKGRKLSRRDADLSGVVQDLRGEPFKEDDLVLPEIVMGDFECDVSKQMEPVFEIVWNAAGLSKRDSEG
jgi:hypothetical protein